jgi:hypothetical protein
MWAMKLFRLIVAVSTVSLIPAVLASVETENGWNPVAYWAWLLIGPLAGATALAVDRRNENRVERGLVAALTGLATTIAVPVLFTAIQVSFWYDSDDLPISVYSRQIVEEREANGEVVEFRFGMSLNRSWKSEHFPRDIWYEAEYAWAALGATKQAETRRRLFEEGPRRKMMLTIVVTDTLRRFEIVARAALVIQFGIVFLIGYGLRRRATDDSPRAAT